MAKDYELLKALYKVRQDANAQADRFENELHKPPLRGRSKEKHEAYCIKHRDEARAVSHYCFIREMQIDPD